MKKILVPCDFSDPAVQAFKLAVEIGRQSKGEVFLLNVVEVPVMHETVIMPTLYFEQSFMNETKAAAEKKFAKMVEKWAEDGPPVSFIVEFGATSPTIKQFIADKKIDLVVMGTHGASGAKEFLIGSNTEKIVRGSTVPVLAIKKAVKMTSIKDIVFANDLDLEAEELTLKVKQLQNFFNAKLHVLYVNTPGSFKRDSVTNKALKDFAKRFMLKDYTLNVFNDMDQESGVRNIVQSIGADMVAMATHGSKGLNHFLSGSIAEDVVNHLECPIWTYQAKD
ncbi:MAG: universal stress protein [Cytophagales bacterium]|nr:universal stress protein [Cytophagales bacterium]